MLLLLTQRKNKNNHAAIHRPSRSEIGILSPPRQEQRTTHKSQHDTEKLATHNTASSSYRIESRRATKQEQQASNLPKYTRTHTQSQTQREREREGKEMVGGIESGVSPCGHRARTNSLSAVTVVAWSCMLGPMSEPSSSRNLTSTASIPPPPPPPLAISLSPPVCSTKIPPTAASAAAAAAAAGGGGG